MLSDINGDISYMSFYFFQSSAQITDLDAMEQERFNNRLLFYVNSIGNGLIYQAFDVTLNSFMQKEDYKIDYFSN